MSLRDQIQTEIKQALKNKEKQKLTTLRFLFSQIQNKEIEKGRQKLIDQEIINLINNQIKKAKENLVFFEKGKREDLLQKTKAEIEILSTYLPQQLSDEELEKEVDQIISQNPSISQPGPLIGLAIKKLAGRTDSAKIAQLVKEKLK